MRALSIPSLPELHCLLLGVLGSFGGRIVPSKRVASMVTRPMGSWKKQDMFMVKEEKPKTEEEGVRMSEEER